MTSIARRLLRIRPFLRRDLVLFSSSVDSKSPPLSPDIPNSKFEAVNQLNSVSSKVQRLDIPGAIDVNDPNEKRDGIGGKRLIPGAIDGHTLNDPYEKLDGGKANVEVCCKCCALLTQSKRTVNIEETAIAVVEAIDEQPELSLNERLTLAEKLMMSPVHYALFKAYKGEKRASFLQSLLDW